MLKQWQSKNLGCFYVILPDGTNRVLTSDGVLIDYETSKNLTQTQYNAMKQGAKYDYQATVASDKLTQKKYYPSPLFDDDVEQTETKGRGRPVGSLNKPKAETPPAVPVMARKDLMREKPKEVEKPMETEKKPTTVVETRKADAVESKPVKATETTVEAPVAKVKAKADYINIVERVIMLCVSVMTIILSIYYTRAYLMCTNGNFIATILSVSMLIYSLIGLQLVTLFKKKKNYVRAVLFFVTSIMTIGFSMFTSLDVNITRYLENNKVEQEERAKTDASTLVLQGIQEQKRQNRQTVEMLVKDIEYYQSRKLNTYTQREQIKELDEEYRKLSEKEISLLTGDNSVLPTAERTEVSSLVGVIGKATGFDKDVLQMLIMCFASVFIDILAPLALNIAIFGKEEDEENKVKPKLRLDYMK